MRWELRLLSLNQLEKLLVVVGNKRVLADAHKIQGHSTSPQVCQTPTKLLTNASFGREEECRASIDCGQVGPIEWQHRTHAEVRQLNVLEFVNQNVLWFYVPVDYIHHRMTVVEASISYLNTFRIS